MNNKIFLLSIILLLSSCAEETIIIDHCDNRVIDAFQIEPDISVKGNLYVDDIIK